MALLLRLAVGRQFNNYRPFQNQVYECFRQNSTKSWFRSDKSSTTEKTGVSSSSTPTPTPIETEANVTTSSTTTSPTTGPEAIPSTPPTPRLKRYQILVITYCKNLSKEYKDALIEAYKDGKSKPLNTSLYLSLLAGLCYLIYSNPTEENFQQEFITKRELLDLVGAKIRSPKSEEYLRDLTSLSIHGQLRYWNLILCSIVWKHDEDKHLGLYPTQCKYLKPSWLEIFNERIVDIGLLNHWWISEKIMKDYDVNEKEWENFDPSKASLKQVM